MIKVYEVLENTDYLYAGDLFMQVEEDGDYHLSSIHVTEDEDITYDISINKLIVENSPLLFKEIVKTPEVETVKEEDSKEFDMKNEASIKTRMDQLDTFIKFLETELESGLKSEEEIDDIITVQMNAQKEYWTLQWVLNI